MTAKTILALSQAHRKEPSMANWQALAAAVKAMEGEVSRLTAEVERLTHLQFRQAPCYKFCEANAFQIEIRRLTAERDAYQRAADEQAARHKVERDGLLAEYRETVDSAVTRGNQIVLLRAALQQALEALETCSQGDYSTGHVIDPSFDEDLVNAARDAIEGLLK